MKYKKPPINNDDHVLAYTENGKSIPYVFGKLKNAFISKKITEKISSVYLIRKKTYYFVSYKYTKGFSFEKIGGKQ